MKCVGQQPIDPFGTHVGFQYEIIKMSCACMCEVCSASEVIGLQHTLMKRSSYASAVGALSPCFSFSRAGFGASSSLKC